MGNSSSFKGRFGGSQVSRVPVVTALRHRNPVDIIAKWGSLRLMREKALRDVPKIYWVARQRIAVSSNDGDFRIERFRNSFTILRPSVLTLQLVCHITLHFIHYMYEMWISDSGWHINAVCVGKI